MAQVLNLGFPTQAVMESSWDEICQPRHPFQGLRAHSVVIASTVLKIQFSDQHLIPAPSAILAAFREHSGDN